MGGFNIAANTDLDIVQLNIGYTFCILFFAFGVVCDMQDLYSILFSSAHCFLIKTNPCYYLGTIRR
jgi:hypothetical protein